MEWCKLYATFATDPKVITLTDRAYRRYVDAMCYAALHETDGRAPFPNDRYTRELESAGLVENGVIHGWLGRQRSKADVDAKRTAGRNAARIRWRNGKRNAEPTTEVEVEVERDVETSTTNNLAPAARTRDPLWDVLVEAYGQPTESARGAWNSAAKVLRQAAATPDDVRSMIVALQSTESNWAVITPTALAKHFGQRDVLEGQLRTKAPGQRSRQLADELRRQGR